MMRICIELDFWLQKLEQIERIIYIFCLFINRFDFAYLADRLRRCPNTALERVEKSSD